MFSRNHVHFAVAVLRYALRGRLFNRGAHRPVAGHTVPDDFVGIGVAASDDPVVDDYIIARLKEEGIRRVRLDFTYGDNERPASRFLERLCCDSFRVMLHLVQPFESASRMADQREQAAWRKFVSNTLDSYGDRVDVVEIGSTINRKRWAGYSLSDFLMMWDIAYHEVRSRGITLAGPSVTDFEPLFNIGILSLLKKRGQLPDIHTDNLFSERCTEPERYDHKVFGRRLASVAKVNLIKKAAILQRIGAYFGVPKLLSPAAFWTLPRIERMLPDSEQKQADYLSRYMVLCAASGLLEGAWWGPLICHREGLIDDGDACYPDLERITHYAKVNGALGKIRERPAFKALRAFTDMIPGCGYEGRLTVAPELEVHAFRSSKFLIHVVWTTNGKAAALCDLFEPDDIAAAEWFSRNGQKLEEMPTLATESPLYLRWASSARVDVNVDAKILSDVVIHRHMEGKAHYLFRDGDWQGVVVASDAQEASVLIERLHPAQLANPNRDGILRLARNAIWKLDDPRSPSRQLVVKQPVKMHLHKRLFDRFKPSKGLRSWNGTSDLLRRGISAAPPIAFFECIRRSNVFKNYYICEYVPSKVSARELAVNFARGEALFLGVSEEESYRALSCFLLKMHGHGMHFRDLSGGNILVRLSTERELEFTLIDTGRIHAYGHALSTWQRISDLVRVCNKMSAIGRERFVGMYFRNIGLNYARKWSVPFFVYDMKVKLKRSVGRKAIAKLFK